MMVRQSAKSPEQNLGSPPGRGSGRKVNDQLASDLAEAPIDLGFIGQFLFEFSGENRGMPREHDRPLIDLVGQAELFGRLGDALGVELAGRVEGEAVLVTGDPSDTSVGVDSTVGLDVEDP